jgi:hypothetical protein
MYQQPSRADIAWRALTLTLRIARRLIRLLLRRPLIDVLLLLFALWLIAGIIGKLTAPQPVLYQPPTLIEGR